MRPSTTVLKRAVLICGGVLVAILLFLWLTLPAIIQSQAGKFVIEKTGHRLTLERPEFNPFTLALRIGRLQLAEPDGKPLLSFDALQVDVSAASIVERALVFDAIRLEGLVAVLVELPGEALNWTPFLKALQSKEPDKPTGLPRLDIRSFVLAGGRIEYTDRRRGEGFSVRAEPLDIELTNLSTLSDDDGSFRLTARTSLGAQLEIAGEIQLNPLAVTGSVSLADLQLARLAPYLANLLPVPPKGVAALSATYRIGNGGDKFDVVVEQIHAKLADLRVSLQEQTEAVASIAAIEVRDGRFQLASRELTIGTIDVADGRLSLPQIEHPPQFAALGIENLRIALAERSASAGSVMLQGARLEAVRRTDGSIDLQQAIDALWPAGRLAADNPPVTEAAPPWRFRIEKTRVVDLGLNLRDASLTPAAELALENIALQVEGLGNDLSQPLPLRLSFDVRGGGRCEAEGQVVPAAPSVDIGFKLSELTLKIAQPYLTAKTTLTLADGRLSAQGRIGYDAKGPTFRGEFAVRDLRLLEPDATQPLLAWKILGSRTLSLTQKQLDLGELRLDGLDTQLIIDKDKSINWKRVLKTAAAPAVDAQPAPAAETASVAVPAEPTFTINVDRLRFSKGEMDFADHSLLLPFGTRIHDLHGSIAGLSNRPGAAGQIELDGAVDDYGMARAIGQVDLLNPAQALDLRVQFRNVEMTRLTPYTSTYAGRKIDSGKLSLDLRYRIVQRRLQGENQVVMDQLTLGERIASPSAKDLPLDLAIAILQDADGRIDLDLPVSGSLDDPEFSYGAIIWKAITNVITKIVTAPFRALGALFGGGEQLEHIAFEAGAAQLTPPEREKVSRLAEALAKRPGLLLSVGGSHAEADRVALQDAQLRRAVLAKAGQHVPEIGDPGPVAMSQPKVREALEALYKERYGAAELAALKEGFRRANPGQLEESIASKMISRLSGLLREKKTLSEGEIAQLKGADFHGVLFERLRAGEAIGEDQLQALAQARGENALGVLKAAGVAPERLRLLPPEAAKGEEEKDGEVLLRLALEPLTAVVAENRTVG